MPVPPAAIHDAKTVVQSFLTLTTVHFCAFASSRDFSAPGDVIELARLVVVEQEQPQRRPVLAAGELQHLDVAVRIAEGQDRPAADAAPDATGFIGPSSKTSGFAM